MQSSGSGAAAPRTPDDRQGAALFADRLGRLIAEIYPAALGRPYTDSEIAQRCGLSPQHVGRLRRGEAMPSLAKAAALAALFGVSTDYFHGSGDHPVVRAVERDLERIRRHRAGLPQHTAYRTAGSASEEDAVLLGDPAVRGIAENAAELPPEMRGTVRTLVEQLRKALGGQP
ncbi:helix-turn-helix domain-containing protein [Streptomyces chrestomyceticus]|uniref:helix-turn-helix domain-containing protein n=1 Tax=Streptomyces chrestomyceticus TaxID=68185 RepID=UPI0035A86A19